MRKPTKGKQATPQRQKPTDYVKISRKLYAGQTIEEIFARSKGRLRTK